MFFIGIETLLKNIVQLFLYINLGCLKKYIEQF